ncbi:MAG: GNAT family N-acetyltransferase [Nevskia sp.]|nr:GNAT family N-acetyltransferase [Nevskia sp.]
MNTLRIEVLHGQEIGRQLDALAGLRIEVFRDWPYLYEGSLDYERHYLRTYLDCADSLAVLVFDGDAAIAATTSLPLAAAEEAMRKPFEQAGYDVSRIHYFGESVVRKPYRGRGLGVRFFNEREAHARRLGQTICTFCSVERDPNDPRKPADYVGNDRFWHKRGYVRHPELVTTYSWPDLGSSTSTDKRMVFWLRELPAQ